MSPNTFPCVRCYLMDCPCAEPIDAKLAKAARARHIDALQRARISDHWAELRADNRTAVPA